MKKIFLDKSVCNVVINIGVGKVFLVLILLEIFCCDLLYYN